LLEQWADLIQQAKADTLDLQKHSAEVRVLLQEISERVEAGRWHISGWNIFDVLGQVRREDAHSDVLAWLFTPWEAHGLGDRFLREFVCAVGTEPLPKGRVREVETREEIGPNSARSWLDQHGTEQVERVALPNPRLWRAPTCLRSTSTPWSASRSA
jgi:hypothetical protein